MVGHWGSEEQGLNGSRAFVEDYPEIVDNIHCLIKTMAQVESLI